MSAPSVTYTFTNGNTSDGPQVSQNFTDLVNGLSDGTKDLTINALTCNGAVSLKGTVALGDAASDAIAVTGYLTTPKSQAGSGTQRVALGGTIDSVSAEANSTTGVEDVLVTFSIPANSLAATGDSLEARWWGTTAANANIKRWKVHGGDAPSVVLDTGNLTPNNKDWYIKLFVHRSAADVAKGYAEFFIEDGTTINCQYVETTWTHANAITLKVTTTATSVAADIVSRGSNIRYFPAEI